MIYLELYFTVRSENPTLNSRRLHQTCLGILLLVKEILIVSTLGMRGLSLC